MTNHFYLHEDYDDVAETIKYIRTNGSSLGSVHCHIYHFIVDLCED